MKKPRMRMPLQLRRYPGAQKKSRGLQWGLFTALLLWILSPSWSAPPSREFHVLNPNLRKGPLRVMSLADANRIQVGDATILLDRNQVGILSDGADLHPGAVIRGTGPFVAGSDVDATDLPVPGTFLGTRFVIPHFRDDHTYHILSPDADARITITLNGLVTEITAYKGQVLNFDAGSTNAISGLVESDRPVFVSHSAHGGTRDVYPVPPVARELWGVRSNSAIVGALQDGTTVTVYGSDGSTEQFVLDAGGYRSLQAAPGSQGTGAGIHVVADKPVAAIQAADSDGTEATAFLPTPYLSTEYGIPLEAQYVSIVCPQSAEVLLIQGGSQSAKPCIADGDHPGKIHFGSVDQGVAIHSGTRIESTAPIYAYYESSASNDEHNLTGHKTNYYLLNPRIGEQALMVMSLDSDNWIRAGNTVLWLDRNELGSIPASDLDPGTEIWGLRPFTVGSETDGTDLPLPGSFAGTQFAIPHYRGPQTYYLLSPYGDATAEIRIGDRTDTIFLPEGMQVSYEAGSNTTLAGRIRSSRPILVSHVSGTSGDAYPVPPAAKELWGLRSSNATMAAMEDDTTVIAYTSDGKSATYHLDSGIRKDIHLGNNANQGQGAAIHLVADKPVAAHQVADADGYEATSYLQRAFHGRRFGIPLDTQYVAIVCSEPDTIIRLHDHDNPVTEKTCNGSETYPGKAYFGSAANGTTIRAGAFLESSAPIYVIYEVASTNDEHNLTGFDQAPQSTLPAPVLDPVHGITTNNPLAVSGKAFKGSEVRLYVNGSRQAAVSASVLDGSFEFDIPLVDGENVIYATSWNGIEESKASSIQRVIYQNTIDRSIDNISIVEDTVWTAGTSHSPYIISGTLRIDAGATLQIQPGVVLKFQPGASLDIRGTLLVRGERGNEVVFTSGREAPAKGDWQGIHVGAGGIVDIHHAVIEYADSGILFNGAGASGKVLDSVIRNNGEGIYILGASSPEIGPGNEITRNDNGVYLYGKGGPGGNPQPVIVGNRIHGNRWQALFAGNFHEAAQVRLDARGNWWGSVDPSVIASEIYDYTDNSRNSPTVDYSGYLDGPGGNPVEGERLLGAVTSDLVLTSGVDYLLLGKLVVLPGVTLTIPEGVRLLIPGDWMIEVDGRLVVQGSEGNEVVFTSGQEAPAKGDWQGIHVGAGGGVDIHHAVIEYADSGLYVNGGNVKVTDSLLHFNTNGLYLARAGGVATVSSTQLVYNGMNGIYATGTGADATNPVLRINGSDIFGNGSQQLYLDYYGTGSAITLDATGNWWGTATPRLGAEIRQGYSMPDTSIVDFSGAATGPLLQPALANIFVDNAYISPANGDGVQDVVTVSGTLSEPADWLVEVRDTSGKTLRTFTGSGNVVSAVWNGLDGMSGQVADGRYDFMVKTTAGTRSGPAGGIPVTVDNTPPVADLDDALNGAVLQNVLTAKFDGTAADENFLNYQVEQGAGSAPAAWTILRDVQSTAVNGGQLASWVLSTEEGTAPVANGEYTLRLTVTDRAGNVSIDTATITVDNMTLTSVAAVTSVTGRTDKLDLAQAETIDIRFNLNLPGTVKLRIYPEQQGVEGTTVRTIVRSFTTPGTHSIRWDGKDSAGVPVEDALYIYVLEASDGTRFGRYLPTAAPATTRVDLAGGSYPNFNGYTNDYWRADVALNEPGRVQLVLTLQSLGNKVIYPNGSGVLLEAGTHTLIWDGRDPETGEIYVGTFQVKINHVAFSENAVWVVGNNATPPPTVSGTLSLEVKTDPYLVYLSYGQFTKFSYHLDVPGGEQAYVEIRLLPPGVYDPSDPRAVVVKRQLQATGDYTVQWDGISAGDSNGVTRDIGEDGAYTFAITATTSNGASTLVRSVINAYQ